MLWELLLRFHSLGVVTGQPLRWIHVLCNQKLALDDPL